MMNQKKKKILLRFADVSELVCAYANRVSEKRVTSLAISSNEKYVCFADKFGVVYVVDIGVYNYENTCAINKKAVPILSHYCSIITRLVWHFVYELHVPSFYDWF